MTEQNTGPVSAAEPTGIVNARLHGRPDLWEIRLQSGRIAAVEPQKSPGSAAPAGAVDAAGGLVSRAFAEPHVHPDKSYSLSDVPEGVDLSGIAPGDGFTRAARIKQGFTPENVERRARRAFELAVSNGITKLRATADVDTIAGLNGIEGLLRAREAVRPILDVELVAFPQEGLTRDPGAEELLREALRMGADFIGGWPNVETSGEEERAHVGTVFDLAEEFGVGVDIHADCFLDPNERILEHIADETMRRGFGGRVLASHCAALEIYDDADAARVIGKVARAGIDIAVIPLNLAGEGPRGLSRPQELLAAGVNVAAGSDNMNDGWYPLGTLNPIDRASMAFFGGSFHEESDVDTVWDMVSGASWRALGGEPGDVTVGSEAELVILGVPTRAAALERPLGPLTTIHRGRVVARRAVAERLDLPSGEGR